MDKGLELFYFFTYLFKYFSEETGKKMATPRDLDRFLQFHCEDFPGCNCGGGIYK